jgi:Acetyltransferase (GNAT) domain
MGREPDGVWQDPNRASTSPVYTAEVVDDRLALHRVEPFHRAHPGHPASHVDLLRAAFLSGQEATPFLVQVSCDGDPCLLMVGQLVQGRLRWRFGYQAAQAARFSSIEVRRGGWLGDLSRPALEFLCQYLHGLLRRGVADAIYLSDVPSASTVYQVFGSSSHWLWRDRSPVSSTNWRLRVPRSFSDWQRAQSRREHEDTKRYDTLIRKAFGTAVRVERIDQVADVDRAAGIVERIAGTTYQRGMDTGFRDSARLRARWSAGASGGALDVRLLWLGDQPVAFTSGFVYDGTLWLEHLGYDSAFRRFRPGMQLLLRLIEDLAGRGDVHTIDFGTGDADYKRRLCDDSSGTVSFYVFAPTLRGLWLNGLRGTATGLARVGRASLDRMGLLPWLKRRWRRALLPRESSEDAPPLAGVSGSSRPPRDPG